VELPNLSYGGSAFFNILISRRCFDLCLGRELDPKGLHQTLCLFVLVGEISEGSGHSEHILQVGFLRNAACQG